MKKKVISIIIAVLVIGVFLQIPNTLRYKIEKTFGDPNTFFYGINLGVMVDSLGAYDDEIFLDDEPTATIDYSQYGTQKVELFLYGRFVNSADPLVAILNDKVIYNDNPSKEMSNFYSRYYIEKHFVIDLNDGIKEGQNKLVITTGRANKQFSIDIIK
ncbi:hypothetical protein D3C75_318930 [compost metagenome]